MPAGPTRGETALRSCVVDIRKNFAVRHFFLQVAAEHPRACLNGMSLTPAISNQAIPSGYRHLIVGDGGEGPERDLCECSDYCRIFWRNLCDPSHQDDGVSE